MKELILTINEADALSSLLLALEDEFGTEYEFSAESNIYSCKCSGPAQSCAWH